MFIVTQAVEEKDEVSHCGTGGRVTRSIPQSPFVVGPRKLVICNLSCQLVSFMEDLRHNKRMFSGRKVPYRFTPRSLSQNRLGSMLYKATEP